MVLNFLLAFLKTERLLRDFWALSWLAVNDVCFDEKIKDFVYLLERRKIRSKNEKRENTNSQLFNGILSGLGLLSSQSLLENSLGIDLMYQLSEKFMECSASPKSVGRYTEGQKGCWTNHFTIQRMCEYKQKVHLYFCLKQREEPVGIRGSFQLWILQPEPWFTRTPQLGQHVQKGWFLSPLLVHHCWNHGGDTVVLHKGCMW